MAAKLIEITDLTGGRAAFSIIKKYIMTGRVLIISGSDEIEKSFELGTVRSTDKVIDMIDLEASTLSTYLSTGIDSLDCVRLAGAGDIPVVHDKFKDAYEYIFYCRNDGRCENLNYLKDINLLLIVFSGNDGDLACVELFLNKLRKNHCIEELISVFIFGDDSHLLKNMLSEKFKKDVKIISAGDFLPILNKIGSCRDDQYLIDSGISSEKDMVNETAGLGPLDPLINDASVTEIMVNGPDDIYVEKSGLLHKTDSKFSSEKSLMTIIERIISPLGRRVDESSPIVDARLQDGSRVHAVVPPLSLGGPVLTIRKFSAEILGPEDLVSKGSMSGEIASFLREAVKRKKSIIVSGGTGSGKTTMLNVLSSFIPDSERIVTIEDSAELNLGKPHVVRLESKPPNLEGAGEISIRKLVRASLRMRPDRIIVGECRGAEALDMLQAMNTGHSGSLTTLHANSCRDALTRLETLILFAGFEVPVKAIREQIASAVDIIVQLKRCNDGSRRVESVSEITGIEGTVITMQELFVFHNNVFEKTGLQPECFNDSKIY